MAFNLAYADNGVDLTETGSNFKSYAKTSGTTNPKKPKKPAVDKTVVADTTEVKPVNKLIEIITRRKI